MANEQTKFLDPGISNISQVFDLVNKHSVQLKELAILPKLLENFTREFKELQMKYEMFEEKINMKMKLLKEDVDKLG